MPGLLLPQLLFDHKKCIFFMYVQPAPIMRIFSESNTVWILPAVQAAGNVRVSVLPAHWFFAAKLILLKKYWKPLKKTGHFTELPAA